MEDKTRKTRIELDDFYSLDVSVNETKRTVIAELIVGAGEPDFIYAENFDVPCNYLRTAIKRGISFIDGNNAKTATGTGVKKFSENSFLCG